MFNQWRRRRRRRVHEVKPGDGHQLKRFRIWQLLSRSLFYLKVKHDDGEGGTSVRVYAVDVPYFEWEDTAKLYLDGTHHATSKLPAAFPVEDGVIEVATSMFGLKRMHYFSDDGTARQLYPDADCAEGLRARFDAARPRASRAVGVVSLLVLLLAVALGIPQLVEQITHLPVVEDYADPFISPIHLPAWANTALVIAAVCASIERALRLRYSSILDGDLSDFDW